MFWTECDNYTCQNMCHCCSWFTCQTVFHTGGYILSKCPQSINQWIVLYNLMCNINWMFFSVKLLHLIFLVCFFVLWLTFFLSHSCLWTFYSFNNIPSYRCSYPMLSYLVHFGVLWFRAPIFFNIPKVLLPLPRTLVLKTVCCLNYAV